MNILLVDDVQSNLDVLKLLIDEWFESNNITSSLYTITEAFNGKEAIEKISNKNFDIVFLDVMMPIMDGIETLDAIANLNLSKSPILIMVTALGDQNTKYEAKLHKANAYITKPINQQMVNAMLDRYIDDDSITTNISNNLEEDEFLDFDDFDDFDDNDGFDLDSADIQKDMMDRFNQSHKKIPAKEFLAEYPNLEYILADLSDLDESINDILDYLESDTLQNNIAIIVELLKQYSIFLNNFVDFYELSTSLNLLSELLENSNFDLLQQEHKEFISLFIKAILQDLLDWKEHVFIVQDAVDVFYINASILNSCIQLESYIKTNLQG